MGRLVVATRKGFCYCTPSNHSHGQNGGQAEFSKHGFLCLPAELRLRSEGHRSRRIWKPPFSSRLPEHCAVARALPAKSRKHLYWGNGFGLLLGSPREMPGEISLTVSERRSSFPGTQLPSSCPPLARLFMPNMGSQTKRRCSRLWRRQGFLGTFSQKKLPKLQWC